MKILLTGLLLAAFTFTTCRAASDKANHLDDKDDINALLKSLAVSQDKTDKDDANALLKELAASQDAPDEDVVNTLLKDLAASQDDTSDNDSDENDDDLTEIQTVFDVLDQVKQEQAKAMQDDDDDNDNDSDDENAENQVIFQGGRSLKRYGRRYLRRYAWRTIRRAGGKYIRNYLRRRFCNEKEAMLQELNDEAGDDDDDTIFAELQSLFDVRKELKALMAQDNETANTELFPWFRWRIWWAKRRIGRKIRRTIRKRLC